MRFEIGSQSEAVSARQIVLRAKDRDLHALPWPQRSSRVAESVRWRLAHPSQRPWTAEDARADDAALRHA